MQTYGHVGLCRYKQGRRKGTGRRGLIPSVDSCGNEYWVYLTNVSYYDIYRHAGLVRQLNLV